jgi:hypothetical protein
MTDRNPKKTLLHIPNCAKNHEKKIHRKLKIKSAILCGLLLQAVFYYSHLDLLLHKNVPIF